MLISKTIFGLYDNWCGPPIAFPCENGLTKATKVYQLEYGTSITKISTASHPYICKQVWHVWPIHV